MNRTSFFKFGKFLLPPVLLLLTLACNAPDVQQMVMEAVFWKCYPVDRAAYERAAAELGQTPETPERPEYATYEVCVSGGDPENTVKAVRMSEGYAPSAAEQGSSPAADQEGPSAAALGSSSAAGAWTGENIETPPDWELVEAEFTIQVAEDGTVTGTRTFVISKDSNGPTCNWHWENGHFTTFSGHIAGTEGIVTIANESYTVSDDSDCGGSRNQQTFESVCETAQITISGSTMEISGDGSEDCGFVFTAHK